MQPLAPCYLQLLGTQSICKYKRLAARTTVASAMPGAGATAQRSECCPFAALHVLLQWIDARTQQRALTSTKAARTTVASAMHGAGATAKVEVRGMGCGLEVSNMFLCSHYHDLPRLCCSTATAATATSVASRPSATMDVVGVACSSFVIHFDARSRWTNRCASCSACGDGSHWPTTHRQAILSSIAFVAVILRPSLPQLLHGTYCRAGFTQLLPCPAACNLLPQLVYCIGCLLRLCYHCRCVWFLPLTLRAAWRGVTALLAAILCHPPPLLQ
jgi:hypothetical protein